MKSQSLLSLFLSSLALAQDLPSLTEVLTSHAEQLSALVGLLEDQPAIVQALGSASNITILAPSNEAFETLLSDNQVAEQVAADPSLVAAILQYHVLTGAYYAANFTETPLFIETLLSNETYESVEGGQVVEAVAAADSVTFLSALKAESTVTQADVEFAGGVIHIIDTVLTIPQNVVDTATAANLTSLAGAATTADLVDTLLAAEDITIFAPNNDAFAALGPLDDVSQEDLASILQYHVVAGTVAYSSSLSNTSVETLAGESVDISIRDGDVYVNDAKVVLADVLIANGVVHVIDSVLMPETAPSSSASSSAPAPSGEPSEVPESAAPRATAAVAVGVVLGAFVMVMSF